MQQHTGQHLLSAVFQERFGLPTVSFHLGESVSTIDLEGPQPSPLILEGAARAANAIVFEDREITVRYGTAEQLARTGIRKQVERSGTLRAVEIAGIDLQPCGGTHVRRTGQIGTVLLRSCTKIRQDWRVEFVCGHRAEAAARKDAELLSRASAQLKCAPQDLDAAVERLLRERETSVRALKALRPKVAEAEAAALLAETPPAGTSFRVIARVLDNSDPDYLQYLATALAQAGSAVALLAGRETGILVFAENPAVAKDMNALLKKVFEQYSGKGGGSKDFARGALADPSRVPAALDLAKSLL
jgi:alanyl-tRNA synthetase